MKNTYVKKRILALILATLTIFSMNMVIVYAEVTLNGTVDETDWDHWFKDDSESPIVDVYWANSSDYLYIGIVTDDTNENIDVLEFAFKASEEDHWIQIIPGISTQYSTRESAPTPLFQGYWQTINTGLPPGVNAVAGKTHGNRSYEISIELSILGNKARDLPESLEIWYKIQDGAPDGPENYPDTYMNWNWEEEPITPTFHIPELPLGTIMALISMFLAMAIFMKKPSFIQLRR
jgi:hypothetical protein